MLESNSCRLYCYQGLKDLNVCLVYKPILKYHGIMDLWNSIILYSNGIDRVFLWYNMLAIDNFFGTKKECYIDVELSRFFLLKSIEF